jgi:hypothetical protein
MPPYRSKYDPMHSATRAALLAQGMSEEEAMIASAWETIRARQADVAATIPRDADGRPSLDDDEAAFDASMADAMGQSNLAAAATPLEMEPEFGRSSRPTPVYRRAPGPVDYGTGESEAGEDIYDPKAAAAYRTRVPSAMATEAQMEQARSTPLYRGGLSLPSPEDDAQYRRGQVMTFDPVTGARGYSPVHPTDLPVGPGEPGRLGRRLDLERPVIDPRTGQPIQGTQKYESVPVDTPFGKHDVYRPSDAFREQLGKQEQRKRIERLGSAAGMDDAAIVAMASGEGPVDLEALRSAGRLRRQAGREERLAEVSRRAMERQNPTALLNDEWRQFVNANRLLGGNRAGASPSDVALGREQADAAMQARMGFGRDQRSSTAEENLINNRADAERRANTDPRELASAAVAAGQLNHSDVFKYADDLVNANYSSRPGLLGVSTYFTDNEVRLGAQRLADDLQMPLEEAEKIMRRIQQDRNRNVNASNIASFFYDQ